MSHFASENCVIGLNRKFRVHTEHISIWTVMQMKKLATCLIVFIALANFGCVSSLHPFYTEADVIFDKCLLGKWSDREYKFSWLFERRGPRAYRLTQVDEDGEATLFEATLFKLNGRTFLNVAPLGSKDKDRANLLRTNTLISITIENERLRISTLDPNRLRDHLNRFPQDLKHAFVENEVVLTDTTENIQAFIRRVMNTPEAFEPAEDVIKQGEIK